MLKHRHKNWAILWKIKRILYIGAISSGGQTLHCTVDWCYQGRQVECERVYLLHEYLSHVVNATYLFQLVYLDLVT